MHTPAHSMASPHPDQLLQRLKKQLAPPLQSVDRYIAHALHTHLGLIQDVCFYLLHNGGKRIRPLLVLLCANACGYTGTQHIDLAAILELLHTATLLHDDVVDASPLRRHHNTAHRVWDNQTSILVGDFLHAWSFRTLVDIGHPRILQEIAHATTAIVTGEIKQLMQKHQINTDADIYMDIIHKKTALLFKIAAQIGGLLAQRPDHEIIALGKYGDALGIAFQLIDDVLDYQSDPHLLGKQMGTDIAEGKTTLPLIYTLNKSTPDEKKQLHAALQNPDPVGGQYVTACIQRYDALGYTRSLASKYAQSARDALQSVRIEPKHATYLQGLIDLTDIAVHRHH